MGMCGSLTLEGVELVDINNGSIGTVDSSSFSADLCISDDCVLGDLNGDARPTLSDVIAALRISVGLDASPDDCAIQAGDVNGDERIDTADAVMIQRMALGLPINPGSEKRGGKGGDIVVSVGTVEAEPGGSVSVPIRVNNAAGLAGSDIEVTFPSGGDGLTLDSVEGTDLTADFNLQKNDMGGRVKVAMSNGNGEELPSGAGDLVILNFTVSDLAAAGPVDIAIESVKLAAQFGDSLDLDFTVTTQDGAVTVVSSTGGGGEAPTEGDGGTGTGCAASAGGQNRPPFRRIADDFVLVVLLGFGLLAYGRRRGRSGTGTGMVAGK